jgi:hypothetical protein
VRRVPQCAGIGSHPPAHSSAPPSTKRNRDDVLGKNTTRWSRPRTGSDRTHRVLDARIEDVIGPFSHILERFDDITGVGTTAAKELIAETSIDVTRFPGPAHLVSWAKFAPMD